MGRAAQRAVSAGATRLVSSSGGNAGYAVACAGQRLDIPVTVVVPTTTDAQMRHLIQSAGAEVLVAGAVWDEAHQTALALAEQTGGVVLHPFDHPDIWSGHATMVDEVAEQGLVPTAIALAVGGGGLLAGVVEGARAHGWNDVPIAAVETQGAASFAAALEAGCPVEIPAITTLALTLGARKVCQRAVELAQIHPVVSSLVSDAAAITGCARMLNDHRVLVEPSCGAALSVVYSGELNDLGDDGPLLVIVCGGAGVTLQKLQRWQALVQ